MNQYLKTILKAALLIGLVAILLSSCTMQQKANRKIKWLKDHNYLTTKKDTIRDTIPEYKDTGSIKLLVEYDSIDKWNIKDTCYTKARANKILSVIKIDSVKVDNERINLTIWMGKDGKIMYDYNVKEVIIEKPIEVPILKDCPKEKWWEKFWIGFVVAVVVGIILGFLFRRK